MCERTFQRKVDCRRHAETHHESHLDINLKPSTSLQKNNLKNTLEIKFKNNNKKISPFLIQDSDKNQLKTSFFLENCINNNTKNSKAATTTNIEYNSSIF